MNNVHKRSRVVQAHDLIGGFVQKGVTWYFARASDHGRAMRDEDPREWVWPPLSPDQVIVQVFQCGVELRWTVMPKAGHILILSLEQPEMAMHHILYGRWLVNGQPCKLCTWDTQALPMGSVLTHGWAWNWGKLTWKCSLLGCSPRLWKEETLHIFPFTTHDSDMRHEILVAIVGKLKLHSNWHTSTIAMLTTIDGILELQWGLWRTYCYWPKLAHIKM